MTATKGVWRVLAAVLVAAGIALTAAAAETGKKQVPTSRPRMVLSFAPLVKRVAPAVVNIYTRKVVRARQRTPLFDDPIFRQFFGDNLGLGKPRKRIQRSLGSGVIVNSKGLIVTNGHVIEGADEIKVALTDRREFDATIVGVDERTDLAVLRIDAGGEALPFLRLGDSDKLEVGDLVLAIGNPFGVGQTVTSGIVSGQARTKVGKSDLNFFIQTDAAINPGNSGGALVTMDGRVAGINTMILSRSGGSLGIGFAIPSNMVHSVVSGVVQSGRLVRPWLGAWGQTVDADIAASLGMNRPLGALIKSVYRKGPADRAKLRVGDVVIAVNGHEINDYQALKFRIATLAVGGSAQLTVLRKKKKKTFTLRLIEAPEDPPRETTELGGPQPLAGAVVANLSPALADELGMDGFKPGVIVMELRRGSNAGRLGIRDGDILLEVNGEEVKSVRRLKKMLSKRTRHWRIAIRRNGETVEVNVRL